MEKNQKRMERGSRKSSSSAGNEKVGRVGGRYEKMEGHCSTGQSPQWAVVSMAYGEEEVSNIMFTLSHLYILWYLEGDCLTQVRSEEEHTV